MKIYLKEFKLKSSIKDRSKLNRWIYYNAFELRYLGDMMKSIYKNVLDIIARFTDDETLTVFVFCRRELTKKEYNYVDDCVNYSLVGTMLVYWNSFPSNLFTMKNRKIIDVKSYGELKELTDEYFIYEDSKDLVNPMNKLSLDNIKSNRFVYEFSDFTIGPDENYSLSALYLFEYLRSRNMKYEDLFTCGAFIYTSEKSYSFIIFAKEKIDDEILKLLNKVGSGFVYTIYKKFIGDGYGPTSSIQLIKNTRELTCPYFEDRIEFKLKERS